MAAALGNVGEWAGDSVLAAIARSGDVTQHGIGGQWILRAPGRSGSDYSAANDVLNKLAWTEAVCDRGIPFYLSGRPRPWFSSNGQPRRAAASDADSAARTRLSATVRRYCASTPATVR